MKRQKLLADALLGIFMLAFLSFQPVLARDLSSSKKYCLRLYGGLNYLGGGDLNQGMKGFTDFWLDMLTNEGFTNSGEYEPANRGVDLGADLVLQLTSKIGVGFGAGYIQASKESKMTSLKSGRTVEMKARPEASAVPIKAGIYFNYPLNKTFNLSLNVGVGYYLAEISTIYRFEEDGDWLEFNQEAKANRLGFHGGIGLEIRLSSKISLLIEGLGRYAKFRGFEGTYEQSAEGGWSDVEEGKLYFFKVRAFWSGKEFPYILVQETEPSGFGLSEAREAKIDFSGGSLGAGLLIKF